MSHSQKHTFVVCAYGESAFLRDCIESLKAQSVKTNILLYTSTPNDSIKDASVSFDIPLVVRGGKPGIANDWNRAMACANTPLVTIAHQDDIYLPTYTEAMLKMIGSTNDPIIFFSDYAELREEGVVSNNTLLRIKKAMLSPLKNSRLHRSRFIRRRILSLGTPICCPSVTFNTDLVPLPLFNDSMRCSLDWQAWERLSRLEGSFCYSPETLMLHRIHSKSETTALIADKTRTREDYEMLQKFWPKPIALLINRLYSKSQESNA